MGAKSGLRFSWEYREWFTEGKHPRLKAWEGRAVTATRYDSDAFEDEVGVGVDDDAEEKEYVDLTMVEALGEGEDEEWTVISRPKSASAGLSRAKQQREYTTPRKEGSAMLESEWPIPKHKNQVKRSREHRKKKKASHRQKAAAFKGVTDTTTPSQSDPAASSQTTDAGRNMAPVDSPIPIRLGNSSSSPSSESPQTMGALESSSPPGRVRAAGTPRSSSPADLMRAAGASSSPPVPAEPFPNCEQWRFLD